MNVKEIVPHTEGTIVHYVVTALSFTCFSVWIITALQSRYKFRPDVTFWVRLCWPVLFLLRLFGKDPYAPTTPDPVQHDVLFEMIKLDQGLFHEPL